MSVIHIDFSIHNDYLQLTKTYLCEDSESAYMLWDFMDDYIAEENIAANEKGFYLKGIRHKMAQYAVTLSAVYSSFNLNSNYEEIRKQFDSIVSDFEKALEYRNERKKDWNDAMNTVDELPAVDAVPMVHARWRELKDGREECTNCLGLCPHEENYNGDVIFNFGCEYCPWCGAKMDGRDDNAAD